VPENILASALTTSRCIVIAIKLVLLY